MARLHTLNNDNTAVIQLADNVVCEEGGSAPNLSDVEVLFRCHRCKAVKRDVREIMEHLSNDSCSGIGTKEAENKDEILNTDQPPGTGGVKKEKMSPDENETVGNGSVEDRTAGQASSTSDPEEPKALSLVEKAAIEAGIGQSVMCEEKGSDSCETVTGITQEILDKSTNLIPSEGPDSEIKPQASTQGRRGRPRKQLTPRRESQKIHERSKLPEPAVDTPTTSGRKTRSSVVDSSDEKSPQKHMTRSSTGTIKRTSVLRLLGSKKASPSRPVGGQVSSPGRPTGGKVSRPGRPAGGKGSSPGRPAGGKGSSPGRPASDKLSSTGRPAGGKVSGPGRPASGKVSSPGRPAGGKVSGPGRPAGSSGQPAGNKVSTPGRPSGGKTVPPAKSVKAAESTAKSVKNVVSPTRSAQDVEQNKKSGTPLSAQTPGRMTRSRSNTAEEESCIKEPANKKPCLTNITKVDEKTIPSPRPRGRPRKVPIIENQSKCNEQNDTKDSSDTVEIKVMPAKDSETEADGIVANKESSNENQIVTETGDNSCSETGQTIDHETDNMDVASAQENAAEDIEQATENDETDGGELETNVKTTDKIKDVEAPSVDHGESSDITFEVKVSKRKRTCMKKPKKRIEYRCPKCTTRTYFNVEEELEIHMKCHTADPNEYKCPYCESKSGNWFDMLKHLSTHEDMQEHFQRKKLYKKDVGSRVCPICWEKFENKRVLGVHIRKEHQMCEMDKVERICEICGKTLYNVDPKTFRRHFEKCQNIIKKCEFCSYSTKVTSNLRKHVKIHTGQGVECEVCKAVFPSRTRYENHRIIHQQNRSRVVCEFCGMEFLRQNTLSNHIMRFHTSTEEYFQCPHCPLKCKLKNDLSKHVKTVHQKKHQCPHCPYQSNSDQAYEQHMEYHGGGRMYVCKFEGCFYRGQTPKQLSNHISQVHRLQSRHQCPICQRLYKKKTHLARHLVSHTDDKPYECVECGARFTNHSAYYRHRKKTGHDANRRSIASVPQGISIEYREVEVAVPDGTSGLPGLDYQEVEVNVPQHSVQDAQPQECAVETTEADHNLESIRLILKMHEDSVKQSMEANMAEHQVVMSEKAVSEQEAGEVVPATNVIELPADAVYETVTAENVQTYVEVREGEEGGETTQYIVFMPSDGNTDEPEAALSMLQLQSGIQGLQ